jgi:benzoate/toluate 1,2-dioxygenase reductase component
MATIAFHFEDGYTRIVEGQQGETVANTAFSARINIPLDCNDGVCGTCKCRVQSGQFDMGDEYIEDAITDAEIAEGYGLACQMVPQTDMVIAILASSKACKVKNETVATVIEKIEWLSDEIIKLTVQTKDKRNIHFLAGQYANIEIPKSGGKTRSFSFSGASGTDLLTFIIRLVPNGLASNYFKADAHLGDVLNMTAPFGSFYLRTLTAPSLFFAGGTGIAPFLAMLEKLHTDGGVQQPIQLFYGATTDANLVELALLDDFKSKLPFDYKTCVSMETSQIHAQGFVNQWINKDYLGTTAYDMYICGPPPMVNAVRKSIQTAGVNSYHFYEEKFNPSGI